MIKITSADRYFSLCVRKRSNWSCERCGKGYTPPTAALHCSHFLGRGNWGTRFDPLNAVALCFGCHQHLGSRPLEHAEFMAQRLGIPEIDRLRAQASRPAYGIKRRLKEIAAHYRLEHDRMKLGGHFAGFA